MMSEEPTDDKNNDTFVILVAEDEKPMAKALQLKLRGRGYVVDIAQDGQKALEMVQNKMYDLVVLDLIMPVLSGFAFMEQVKNLKIKTPIIIASNLSQSQDLQKALEMGAVDYFVKSNSTLKEIVAKIETFLTSQIKPESTNKKA